MTRIRKSVETHKAGGDPLAIMDAVDMLPGPALPTRGTLVEILSEIVHADDICTSDQAFRLMARTALDRARSIVNREGQVL